MIGALCTLSALISIFTGANGGVIQQKNSANVPVDYNIKFSRTDGFGAFMTELVTDYTGVNLTYDNNEVGIVPFDSYSTFTYNTVYYDLISGDSSTQLELFDIVYYQNYQSKGPAVVYTSYLPMNFYVDFAYEVTVDSVISTVECSFNNLTCFLTAENLAQISIVDPTSRYGQSVYYLPSSLGVPSINSSNFIISYNIYWFYADWNVTDLIEGGGIGLDYWDGYSTAVWQMDGNSTLYPDYTDGYNAGYTIGYNDGTSAEIDTVYSNGYDNGYNYGQQDGYNAGFTAGVDSVDTDSYYLDGINTGYWNGYAVGYNEGLTSPTYTFGELFGSIADTPVLIVRGLFDFDFFGINLMTVVLSMFTALIALYIVRKLL